ncbi:hypothetical protein [Saccharicrinis sp. 156]|uniref:hypothetical protein n=1 Tax=Saccharicrinis sp. 156 TaxID=3417574 RepID=UPI003D32CB36
MRTLNVETRIRNTFALALSFMVLSTTVWASGLSRMEPMPVKPVITSNFEYLISSLYENDFEETLEVEGWMLNLETFVENDNKAPALAIESWMTDVNTYIPETMEPELTVELWMTNMEAYRSELSEPALALEEWMMDVDAFEVEIETGLALEYWMTNEYAFIIDENEPELAIESWMTNIDAFVCAEQILALK